MLDLELLPVHSEAQLEGLGFFEGGVAPYGLQLVQVRGGQRGQKRDRAFQDYVYLLAVLTAYYF